MNVAKFDKWTWWLIYGGLLGLSWTLFIAPEEAAAIWTIRGISVVVLLAGIGMVVARSKMKDSK